MARASPPSLLLQNISEKADSAAFFSRETHLLRGSFRGTQETEAEIPGGYPVHTGGAAEAAFLSTIIGDGNTAWKSN